MAMIRKVSTEALETAMLTVSVFGRGIMGEILAGGNTAVALLASAMANSCML